MKYPRRIYLLIGLVTLVTGTHRLQAGQGGTCPLAETPLAEDSLGIACTTNADCPNESSCIDGVCYVPKNRFVSFRPGNAGTSVAFLVHSPGCPDQDRWVGSPGIRCNGPALISRLDTAPFYSDAWPETIHLGDPGTVPGTRYEIRAVEAACDTGDPASYSSELTLPTTRVWADTVGRFVDGSWEPPNQTVNADDLRAAIDSFRSWPSAPPLIWTEVDSEYPDLCTSFGTLSQIIDGFRGYPYDSYGRGAEVCWCYTADECDDGVYCNGAEVCTGDYYCVPGDDPCPGQLCDEDSQSCAACADDGDCDDGLYCTGQEVCDSGVCEDGSYPCGSDACREDDDTCGPTAGPLASLVPVDAWSGDAVFDGNTVTLTGGGHVVVLEVFLSGWDPDMDGAPGLVDFQATLDPRSLSNGSPGPIGYAQVPCVEHNDCVDGFGGICGYPGGDDLCTPAFQNRNRADYVGQDTPAADSHTPGARFLGNQFFSLPVTDDGIERYAGTVVLEVPGEAAGMYTIRLHPDEDKTFMNEEDAARIPGLSTSPAIIVVITDCNNNGQVDQDEIEAGTAADCNANSLPDTCDLAAGRSEDCTGNRTPDECEPDCNSNGVPDSCDTLAGTSEDCNANEIPDECDFVADCNGNGTPDTCECLASVTPAPEAEVIAKNRYLTFEPDDLNPGCTRTALRVTLTDMPDAFSAIEGDTYWVGEPHPITEVSGSGDPDATPPTFTGARLKCTEHCMDWSGVGRVHAFGAAVIPGGSYSIQAVACACDLGVELNYSASLPVASSVWGDVVGDYGGGGWTAPNGVVDFGDISVVVDKFKNEPYAPIKARADIAENGPDTRVDFNDIGRVVDAFRGGSYPFTGPTPCE